MHRRKTTASRSTTLAAFAAGATLLLGACGAETSPSAGSCDDGVDRTRWRAEASRQAEADRIVDCRLLSGRSKAEVRAMLGRPWQRGAENTWLYITGDQRDFGSLDDEAMFVEFGRADRVRYVGLGNL